MHTCLSRSSPHHRAIGEHLPPGDPVVGRGDPKHAPVPRDVPRGMATMHPDEGILPGEREDAMSVVLPPAPEALLPFPPPGAPAPLRLPGVSTFSITAQMPPPPESLPGTRPSSGLLTGQGGSRGPGLAGATSGTASCGDLPGSRLQGSAGPGRRRAKWSFRRL